jgi:hypothetical protein
MLRHLKYFKRRDSSTIGLGFKPGENNNVAKYNRKEHDESEQYNLLLQQKRIKTSLP